MENINNDPLYKKFRLACENDDVPLFIEYINEVNKWGNIILNFRGRAYSKWHNIVNTYEVAYYNIPFITKLNGIISVVIKLGSIKICKYIIQTYDPNIIKQLQLSNDHYDTNNIAHDIAKSPNGIRIITEIFQNKINSNRYGVLFADACHYNNKPIVDWLLERITYMTIHDKVKYVRECVNCRNSQLALYLIEKFKFERQELVQLMEKVLQYPNIQLIRMILPLIINDNRELLQTYIEKVVQASEYINAKTLFEYAKENDLMSIINWETIADSTIYNKNMHIDKQHTLKVIMQYMPYTSNTSLITPTLAVHIMECGEIDIVKRMFTDNHLNNVFNILAISARNLNIEVYKYCKSVYALPISELEFHGIATQLMYAKHYEYLMEHKEYIVFPDKLCLVLGKKSSDDTLVFIKWLLETFPLQDEQYYEIFKHYIKISEYEYAGMIMLDYINATWSKKCIAYIMKYAGKYFLPIKLIHAILATNLQLTEQFLYRCASSTIYHYDVELLMRIIPCIHKRIVPLMKEAYRYDAYECLSSMHQYIVCYDES